MRRTAGPARWLSFVVLAAVLSLAGCTDTAALCQAHLIPINVPADPGPSPQARASRP